MALLEVPKRERIVQELLRRLRRAFPNVPTERGFFADAVTIFPSIYLFEDEETTERSRTDKRGLYVKTLPLVISFNLKGDKQTTAYQKANTVLAELQQAVEYDELFCEGFDGTGSPPVNTNLVTEYYLSAASIMLYMPNIAVNVEATYNFVYADFAPWAKTKRR